MAQPQGWMIGQLPFLAFLKFLWSGEFKAASGKPPSNGEASDFMTSWRRSFHGLNKNALTLQPNWQNPFSINIPPFNLGCCGLPPSPPLSPSLPHYPGCQDFRKMRRNWEKPEGHGGRKAPVGFNFSCILNPVPSRLPGPSVTDAVAFLLWIPNTRYISLL
jgi:hypothetical protein